MLRLVSNTGKGDLKNEYLFIYGRNADDSNEGDLIGSILFHQATLSYIKTWLFLYKKYLTGRLRLFDKLYCETV